MNLLLVLFWILVVLNVTDAGLTYTILKHGGAEANPYVNYLMQQFGVIKGIMLAKMPPLLLLGYIFYNYEDRINSAVSKYGMVGIVVIYFIVNVYSYILLRGLL